MNELKSISEIKKSVYGDFYVELVIKINDTEHNIDYSCNKKKTLKEKIENGFFENYAKNIEIKEINGVEMVLYSPFRR